MRDSKYSKLLTIILSVVVVGIIILLGFLGFDVYKKFTSNSEVAKVLDDYDATIDSNPDTSANGNTDTPEILAQSTENGDTSSSSGSGAKRVMYKGYNVDGTIEIPAIKLKYPILEKMTPASIEAAVAIMYSANGLNQPGNTVIAGHNYRNGSFFGNNKRLKEGDKIYIKDNSGTRIKYNIYNIYETAPEDSDFIIRETNGKREISLSTCTDNSKARLIIWAVEE